jgi:hypothetical protein
MSETMSPVVKRVRAYFAPVVRGVGTYEGPTIFDAAQSGGFALDSPPAPWVSLGWIDGFVRKCGTKVVALRSGAPATTQMQVRTEIEATVGFAFESWGKAQMALASGTQQMNLLKTAGGVVVGAVALASGSTASVLQVGAAAAASFAVGELVAVDVDYVGAIGFVGAGLSGAYVKAALTDVDYVRRVTLNVGRIASIAAGALTLEAPLLAGVPTSVMKVSGVVGFCDREGSSFFRSGRGCLWVKGSRGSGLCGTIRGCRRRWGLVRM